MSLNPSNFEPKLLIGETAEASTGKNTYSTIKLNYDGNKFNFFVPPPGVYGNAISENPEKKRQLSQGMTLEGAVLKFAEDASDRILDILLEHKDDAGMPDYATHWTSRDDILALRKSGAKIKLLVHYPMKRDPKTKKSTGVRDPKAKPKMYFKMIQAGSNPSNPEYAPWHIFTKYYSAAILAPENAARIKNGQLSESKFVFSAIDLKARKTAMTFMPSIQISDIFIAPGKIIVRIAISEAYIIKFEARESQTRTALAASIAASGMSISGPTELPGMEENNTNVEVEENNFDEDDEREFSINITE